MRFLPIRSNAQRRPRTSLPRYVRTLLVLIVVGVLGLAGGLYTAAPSVAKCPPRNPHCKTTSTATSTTQTTAAPTTTTSSSNLLFDDEFDGPAGTPPSLPWTILGGTAPPRWGEECFVNDTRHVSMDGLGNLALTATSNPSGVPCRNGAGAYESSGVWPFDSYAERPVLDLQVGDWGGTVDAATLPQTMLVDYVRIYKNSSQ